MGFIAQVAPVRVLLMLVIFTGLFLIGLATLFRTVELGIEDPRCGVGINRIRHVYGDLVPGNGLVAGAVAGACRTSASATRGIPPKGERLPRSMDLHERFEWRGREVAWEKLGDGPPVVFCHGTPFSSRVWVPFARALQDDFTVYLWDMPGYGQSSKAAEHPVNFGVHGELFADLLEHWDLDRPHVVAHDFGGAVSLRAHLLHGAAYRSLMLVDVVAVPPTGSPFFRFVHRHSEAMAEIPDYVHEAVVTTYVQAASHRGLRDDDLAALVAPWTTGDGKPAFYRQIAQTEERFLDEIEERLGRVEVPVRVVWGVDDTWIPVDVADRLAGRIPGATVRRVDGAGHLVQYDAPVVLADEVRSWLAKQS